eukprot:m.241502 g.241502  ORF g.241502 m.241502 type:complete len:845 (-) comp13865_c0_seq1:226-2760(-)
MNAGLERALRVIIPLTPSRLQIRAFHLACTAESSASARSRNRQHSTPTLPATGKKAASTVPLEDDDDHKRPQKNMFSYFQVVGHGDTGVEPSLYIFMGKSRVLINCGEGTQRLCMHHKIKLRKFTDILLTRTEWSCTGGVPGMLLSRADSVNNVIAAKQGKEITTPVSVMAPEFTNYLLHSTETFLKGDYLRCTIRDVPPAPEGIRMDIAVLHPLVFDFPTHILEALADNAANSRTDQEITADCPTNQAATIASSADQGSPTAPSSPLPSPPQSPSVPAPDPTSACCDPGPEHPRKRRASSPMIVPKRTRQTRRIACYLFAFDNLPGKMDPARAEALGVPKSMLKVLKLGQSVTLADGTVIQPSDVLIPYPPSPHFLVVDCPVSACLDTIAAHPKIAALYDAPASVKNIVVHLSPANVLDTPAYRAWMDRFGPSTTHVLLAACNGDHTPPLSSAVRQQVLLNAIHPRIFPLNILPSHPPFPANLSANQVVPGDTYKFQLMPVSLFGPEAQLGGPADLPAIVADSMTIPGYADAMAALKPIAATYDAPPAALEPQVQFLGTGSSCPSKHRNVSGIVLGVPGPAALQSILLDCGEGSYAEMLRHHGHDAMPGVLANLKLAIISHMHADHHLGLIRVLLARRRLQLPPLCIIGPTSLAHWMQKYHAIEQLDFYFIDAIHLVGKPLKTHPVLAELGLTEVLSVPVKHCRHSYGTVLRHAAGWSLVYSGDCRPSPSLVKAGQGADVLIHEATFNDDLSMEALAKYHCTIGEALKVARDMDAKTAILTHFSQRYPSIPSVEVAPGHDIGIAFDRMVIPFRYMGLLSHLLPPVKAVLADESAHEEDEDEES